MEMEHRYQSTVRSLVFLGYKTFKNVVFRAEDADQRRVVVKHVPDPRFELYTSKKK